MSGRDAAVAAARRGWAVFPCRPADKRPAVDRWEERACADPERVARYWPSDRHNVGVACGPSGLVVIDLDAHGELPEDWRLPGLRDGTDVLAQLAEWAGQPWPSTYMVLTPTGGWHLYYHAPGGIQVRNSSGAIGPAVDVRGAGGYVLAAGIVLDERAYPDRPALAALVPGTPYEQLDGCDPGPLPAWLCRLLSPPSRAPGAASTAPRGSVPGRLAGLVRTVATAQPGTRNDALYWAANRVRELSAAGDLEAAPAAASLRAAAVAAGLPEREAARTLASAMGGGR